MAQRETVSLVEYNDPFAGLLAHRLIAHLRTPLPDPHDRRSRPKGTDALLLHHGYELIGRSSRSVYSIPGTDKYALKIQFIYYDSQYDDSDSHLDSRETGVGIQARTEYHAYEVLKQELDPEDLIKFVPTYAWGAVRLNAPRDSFLPDNPHRRALVSFTIVERRELLPELVPRVHRKNHKLREFVRDVRDLMADADLSHWDVRASNAGWDVQNERLVVFDYAM